MRRKSGYKGKRGGGEARQVVRQVASHGSDGVEGTGGRAGEACGMTGEEVRRGGGG